jgi:hypothetical protein
MTCPATAGNVEQSYLAGHPAQADERPTVFDLAHVAQAVLVDEALQHLQLADGVAGPDDDLLGSLTLTSKLNQPPGTDDDIPGDR